MSFFFVGGWFVQVSPTSVCWTCLWFYFFSSPLMLLVIYIKKGEKKKKKKTSLCLAWFHACSFDYTVTSLGNDSLPLWWTSMSSTFYRLVDLCQSTVSVLTRWLVYAYHAPLLDWNPSWPRKRADISLVSHCMFSLIHKTTRSNTHMKCLEEKK